MFVKFALSVDEQGLINLNHVVSINSVHFEEDELRGNSIYVDTLNNKRYLILVKPYHSENHVFACLHKLYDVICDTSLPENHIIDINDFYETMTEEEIAKYK